MRSLILAVCVAALPATTAFAAAPRDYSHEATRNLRTTSRPRQQWVLVHFRNPSINTLNVRVAGSSYRVPANSAISLRITVGATVERVDEFNSHRAQETVMQVSATDEGRDVVLS
jgi:hypothetical protein